MLARQREIRKKRTAAEIVANRADWTAQRKLASKRGDRAEVERLSALLADLDQETGAAEVDKTNNFPAVSYACRSRTYDMLELHVTYRICGRRWAPWDCWASLSPQTTAASH